MRDGFHHDVRQVWTCAADRTGACRSGRWSRRGWSFHSDARRGAKFASWVVSPSVTSITHGGTTACTQSIPAAKRFPMPFQTRLEVFGVQTATGRVLHCFGGTLPASKLQCPAHFFLSSVRDRANPLTSKT